MSASLRPSDVRVRGYAAGRRKADAGLARPDRIPALLLTLLPYAAAGIAIMLVPVRKEGLAPGSGVAKEPMIVTMLSPDSIPDRGAPETRQAERQAQPGARPMALAGGPVETSGEPATRPSPSQAIEPRIESPVIHAPAPAATAVPAASRAALVDEQAAYRAELSEHLAARRPAGISVPGRVEVEFDLDPSGKLLGRRIVSSSGSVLLDRLALKLVRDASPYPDWPQE